MNISSSFDAVISDIAVPVSLLADPGRFGGRRDKDCLRGDLLVAGGRARALRRGPMGSEPRGMVLPGLTECHVHLDKCHTIGRMNKVGGDLKAAIEAQARDRQQWSYEDLGARAGRGLQELVEAGCIAVRSHVDWSDGQTSKEAPLAWQVLCDLAEDVRGQVQLQCAALIGVDVLADAAQAKLIAREVAAGQGVLGAFVLDHPERLQGITNAFRMAEAFDLLLDFHVDEGLEDGLDGLEIIADVAVERQFSGPILCGHACSLINRDQSSLARLADKLLAAGITIAVLPTTNLFLQGRRSGTPDRRGLTTVQELRAAGVPVVVGTDNVRDAFCPLGRHDPRQSLGQAVLAAHLDPPYDAVLPMITTDAMRALGVEPIYVDGAAVEDLRVFEASSTCDLLADVTKPQPLTEFLQGVSP